MISFFVWVFPLLACSSTQPSSNRTRIIFLLLFYLRLGEILLYIEDLNSFVCMHICRQLHACSCMHACMRGPVRGPLNTCIALRSNDSRKSSRLLRALQAIERGSCSTTYSSSSSSSRRSSRKRLPMAAAAARLGASWFAAAARPQCL